YTANSHEDTGLPSLRGGESGAAVHVPGACACDGAWPWQVGTGVVRGQARQAWAGPGASPARARRGPPRLAGPRSATLVPSLGRMCWATSRPSTDLSRDKLFAGPLFF